MSIEINTVNRGYPLPHEDNKTAVDVLRLIEALTGIDVDMATALTSLVAKAPLSSPTFSGDPTAPTPVVGDDTNKLATTAFVRRAVADLVNSSPAALDTLNELATALGNDANFATTMTTALAGKQPSNATLTALASLALAADKLLYLNGSAAVALTTLSAFARTLLDDADAAAFYATLGVIPNGQLPARLQNLVAVTSDANAAVDSGFYRVSAATINLPEAAQGVLFVGAVLSGASSQIYIRSSNGNTWTRSLTSGVWGPWSLQYSQGTVLGSVSQSSGVPTGAVIERGSNANGEYVKFADGTLICTSNNLLASGAVTTTSGSIFINDSGTISWTFPAAFANAASVVALGGNARSSQRWVLCITPSATVGSFRVCSSVSSATSLNFDVMAIGRWF